MGELSTEIGEDILHQFNGLVDDGFWCHEDDVPQVIQANELHALRDEAGPVPFGEELPVEVDHAKEAIETSWGKREEDSEGK